MAIGQGTLPKDDQIEYNNEAGGTSTISEPIDLITRTGLVPKTTTTTEITTEDILSNDITVPRVNDKSSNQLINDEMENHSYKESLSVNKLPHELNDNADHMDIKSKNIEPINTIVIPDTSNFLPISNDIDKQEYISDPTSDKEEPPVESNTFLRSERNGEITSNDLRSELRVDKNIQLRASPNQNKTLLFALANDMNSKRSSTYASKSTVKAIPIRNHSSHSMARGFNSYYDNDDVSSLKSRSSSMAASFSKGFLLGFYNNRNKHANNQKVVLSKEYWMKDESARECFTCGKRFNTFRRKHHCRICGQIFCKNCTLIISGERFGYDRSLRVCQNCYKHADNYQDSSDEEYYEEENSVITREPSTNLMNEHLSKKEEQDSMNDFNIQEEGDSSIFNTPNKNNEVLFIHDDDVHSIITSKQDSKLFISTPPPPPKMAIPATKQGESLEIAFNNNLVNRNSNKTISHDGNNEKITIRDLDDPTSYKPNEKKNPNSTPSLRRSLFQYMGKTNRDQANNHMPSNPLPDSSLLNNRNFQFKFNFRPELYNERRKSFGADKFNSNENKNAINVSQSPKLSLEYDNNDLEDEASMSLYSSLHGSIPTDKPIGFVRTSSKSDQRAMASLHRIRHKRTGKSKSISMTYPSNLDSDFISQSSPNLLSVVSDELPLPQPTSILYRTGWDKASTGTNNAWKRHSSLTSVRPSAEPKPELNKVAQIHLNSLLDQVLGDQDIADKELWKNKLLSLLSQIQNIILSAKDLNTLDYRQNYLKIKRITGGSIDASEYINGIVFSKNLPNKHMSRKIENPRILLLMFPVEYERSENKFLSIDSVIAQEKEYLNKLVSRILSLSPDIIYVGANVSGYALDLFCNAGIVIQYNMKPQVLERIAKYTDADIALSIEKLATNIKMGECQLFEVKSYLYDKHISKTYTFLRGCEPTLGGTILLRGANETVLRKIKQIVEFMVYATFSLKLESSFFNDNFLQLSVEHYLLAKTESKNQQPEGYYSDFVEKFNNRLLSVSPTVSFPLPFLLKQARNLERELRLLEDQESTVHAAKEEYQIGLLSDISNKLTKMELVNLGRYIMEKEIQDLKNEYKKRARQWEVYYSLTRNMLGTGSHQSITVLYSMVSIKTATPCIGPQLMTIDYFWDSEISVGQFIENIVSTAWHPCKQGCNTYLFDHYRSYVHGDGKVDVMLERFETKLPKLRDIILTWSYCKKCGCSTPILQISQKTWNYSFGKYLEIMFWSERHSLLGVGKCGHEFTKDHVKYFSYNDLVVRLEYSDLEIHELITPSRRIRWKPNRDIIMKVELYYGILDKINYFYSNVSERLDRIKLDGLVVDKMEPGKQKLNEMKIMLENNKRNLLEKLEKQYKDTPGTEHLHLNSILRSLYNQTNFWNNEFKEFGETYLPSENDITRITTSQLKKIFGEPKKPDFIPESTHLNVSDRSNELERISESQSFISESKEDSVDNNRAAERINALREHTKKPSISTSMINLSKHDQPSFIEHSVPPTTYNDSGYDSRVGKLTNFFDQLHFDALTKEFELERELQKLQLNKSKSRKFRLQNSTPIVEIYKDVKDAVDEPLHNDEKIQNDDSNEVESVDYSNSSKAHRSTQQKKVSEMLESELKNSINRWGEAYINSDSNLASMEHLEKKGETDITKDNNKILDTDQKSVEVAPQPEKSTLMKTLATFWADRSAYLWKPFSFPIGANEHVFTDSDVIIREDEPSSLIAFCLSTSDYNNKMASIKDDTDVAPVEKVVNNQDHKKSSNQQNISDSSEKTHANSNIESVNETSSVLTEEKASVSDKYFDPAKNLEAIMTKKTAIHLRYQFEDGLVVMSCKVFFAEHFEAFRKICNCDENFIQSLSRCVKWHSNGGKSGSGFLKTLDNRFVIKELTHSEVDSFIKFTPSYFEYMAQAMFHDLPTTLAKVFGFFQIQVKNPISGSKNYKMNVIIMENLFYNKKTSRIFDLKGSMRNRHVEQTGKANEVLLDENMVEYIFESPIHVREYDKKLLRASLWNDTLFLAKMNVMDYSLVVGINNDDYTLTVGIIDFIRTFTWDKKLESWVKEKGLVGGGNSIMKQPTVVTPKQYKNRFREAMERYILMVPDPWYQDTN